LKLREDKPLRNIRFKVSTVCVFPMLDRMDIFHFPRYPFAI
jgi:hypothetical protein